MKNIAIIITSVLIWTVTSSCEDLLDTEPNDRLTNETALNDYDGIFGTLMGAYDRLRNIEYYQRDFIVTADALADNLKQTINNTSRLNGISNNRPYAHFNFWQEAYAVISSANFVLTSIDNLTVVTTSQRNQIKAEALFLRALAHFDLVRAYARNPNYPVGEPLGIPIISEQSSSPSKSFPARNTINEVYDQVISDLSEAFNLIESREGFPNRASDIAIQALMARVHLYAGNWDETVTAASYVIDNAGFDIEMNNYVEIFSDASETIFGLAFLNDENPGLNGSLEGLFYVDPNTGIGYGDFVARDDIYNLHESGDLRSNLYISTQKSGENVNFIGKFLGYGGAFGLDNIPLIRLSEVILTRAEARAENDDLAGARSDLNKIRNRAGLGNINTTDKEELKTAIFTERRIELAYEGHRLFDLKRRGSDISKGGNGTDCQDECNIPYTDFRIVANIPISETDVNSNLMQNPGY